MCYGIRLDRCGPNVRVGRPRHLLWTVGAATSASSIHRARGQPGRFGHVDRCGV